MNSVDVCYYDILGVSSNATPDEIKSAYRTAIRACHPDVNGSADASRLSEILNEAYAVLSDAQKRQQYDTSAPPDSIPYDTAQAWPDENWNLHSCDRCGRIDSQLRYAVFHRVWSALVYSEVVADGGVLCVRCRNALTIHTVLFSVILGPWALPWGVLYTLRALTASIRGGEMPRAENAELLRCQGMAYLQRRLFNEARTALRESQRFQRSDSVALLLSDAELFAR